MSDNTPAGRVARCFDDRIKDMARRSEAARPDWGGYRGVRVQADDLSAILAQREALLEALEVATEDYIVSVQNCRGEDPEGWANVRKWRAAIALATGEGA